MINHIQTYAQELNSHPEVCMQKVLATMAELTYTVREPQPLSVQPTGYKDQFNSIFKAAIYNLADATVFLREQSRQVPSEASMTTNNKEQK